MICVEYVYGSGRTQASKTDQNVDRGKELANGDGSITILKNTKMLVTSFLSFQRNFKNNLNICWSVAEFVTHLLGEQKK